MSTETIHFFLYIGTLQDGGVRVGDMLSYTVDVDRRLPVMCNHTATHILNFGLRKAIGEARGCDPDLVGKEECTKRCSPCHAFGLVECGRDGAKIRCTAHCDSLPGSNETFAGSGNESAGSFDGDTYDAEKDSCEQKPYHVFHHQADGVKLCQDVEA